MTQMKKSIISSMIIGALAFTSCNDYLDINTNPSSPSESQLSNDLIYPAVEMAYAANVGDYLRSCAGYLAQFYAQNFGTSNYVVFTQFQPTQARTSTFYTQFNLRVINNANIVKTKAAAENDWATYLAATVMMASSYQNLIDMYGETPYSEALDMSNVMPKFDSGEEVYAGILNDLDEAISKASDNASQATATSFLIPGGKASDWIKVANALKLKIMMREHNVVNVSSALSSLINENNFPTADVEWAGCWANSSEKANPFYSEEFADWGSQKNAVLNCAVEVTMNAYGDARLPVYFTRSSYDGQVHGSVSGTNMNGAAAPYSTTAYWSRPNMAYDTPVSFISLAEIEFFLAEYYAESNISEGAAHYEAAVKASYASAGVSGAEAAIAAYPFDSSNWKRSLGVQKWVHLSGVNTFEGWCELRRLKYPSFDNSVKGVDMYPGTTGCTVDVSILTPGCLYTPYQVYDEVGDNHLAERFPYSTAAADTNDNTPEFPGFLSPIFWAK